MNRALGKGFPLVLACAALGGLSPELHADSIGINFTGGGWTTPTALGPTAVAGVVAQSNWNDEGGKTGAGVTLNNDAGADSGASLSFNTDGLWTANTGRSDGNQALLDGYLDALNATDTSVSITNVPYAVYDVYLYFDSDVAGRLGEYTVNGVTQIAEVDHSGTLELATSTQAGTYIEFARVTGDLDLITAIPDTFRSPLSGIQLVDESTAAAPLPPVGPCGLILVTGFGAVAVLRRRSRSITR
jgi:hypothetical protein